VNTTIVAYAGDIETWRQEFNCPLSRSEKLAVAANFFTNGGEKLSVDGQTLTSFEDADRLWGLTALDVMKEAIDVGQS
jgi:hypothetical protein